jgi:hypothetical protein
MPRDNHRTSPDIRRTIESNRHADFPIGERVWTVIMCPMALPPSDQISVLEAQLQRLAYYGVGRAMGDLAENDLVDLARIARELTPDHRGRLRVSIALAVGKAIDMIDPPKRADAARKLLWLPEDAATLEDDTSRKRKPLSDRHPEVAVFLGYSLTSYERRKKWKSLYNQIATNLIYMRDSRAAAPIQPTQKSTKDPEANYESYILSSAARAGAELHYAGLVALFVAYFHNQCVTDHWLRARRLHPWNDAAIWLFDSYARVQHVMSEFYQSIYPPPYPDDDDRPHPLASSSIDKTTIQNLCNVHDLIELCGPFYIDYDAQTVIGIHGEQLDYGQNERFSAVLDLDFWTDQTTNAEVAFQASWIPWYRSQFGTPIIWPDVSVPISDDRIRPAAISLMTAIAPHIVTIVMEDRRTGSPVFSHAREQALRLISTFYDVSEWQPLNSGRSLRDSANYLFDTVSPELAKQLPFSYDVNQDSWKKIYAQCRKTNQTWISHKKYLHEQAEKRRARDQKLRQEML